MAQSPKSQKLSPEYQKRIDDAYNFLVAKIHPSPSQILSSFGRPATIDTQSVWTEPGLGTNKYITFHFDTLEIELFYQDSSHLYSIQKVTYAKSTLPGSLGVPIGGSEKSVTSFFGKPIVNTNFFPNEFHYQVSGSPTRTLIFVFKNHRLVSIVCQPNYD